MTGARRPLDHDERVAWLRLARTPGLGALGFARLIARFGSAAAVLDAAPSLGRLSPPSSAAAMAELDALDRLGARLLAACEPDFPALLASLDPPPPVLSVRGDVRLLARPAIAIVGARDASAAGRLFAETLARDLGRAGLVVVSGLARGIDAAAHRASLETGTVAVLAGGLDRPYPPQNVALYEEIARAGAAVSELPLGAVARARDFPRRNHIVSGLATAVIVVEAAARSGSLITARAAAEQGRDVMAVPGSPLDPRARGTNALLKEGATLIESAEDVLVALNAAPRLLRDPVGRAPRFAPGAATIRAPPDLADEGELARRVLAALSPTPVPIDALARLLDAPVGAVAAALTELELTGVAETLPGGYAASSSRP
ncbi:MAG: DNA-processing protein DprA [Alphaproteobacteria bacterium]|nr:DNA-processing protein DprA [Alphaproteobacteria bacterium]